MHCEEQWRLYTNFLMKVQNVKYPQLTQCTKKTIKLRNTAESNVPLSSQPVDQDPGNKFSLHFQDQCSSAAPHPSKFFLLLDKQIHKFISKFNFENAKQSTQTKTIPAKFTS